MENELTISDAKPGSILLGIAKTLMVDINEKPNHCWINIPEDYGSGTINLYNFSQGISTIVVKVKLRKKINLKYNVGKIHPLKIIMIKEGYIQHSFDNDDKQPRVSTFENLIIASTPDNNHTFKLPKNLSICFISIQINRKEFESKIDAVLPNMHRDISKIFRDVNGIQTFSYKNFYTPSTLKFIEDYIQNTDDDFFEMIVLEGLTYQLIASNLKQYLINRRTPNIENTLATKTRLKVQQATELIENEIESFTSVGDLAKAVSLNEKTLQSAFKLTYNLTVNSYVRKFRSQKAKHLFETTDLSVAEVAYKLGISSPSHLSKLFKLYYGLTPTAFKKSLNF